MNNKVKFKETVELFINTTVSQIKNEYETPNFNIIFEKDAYEYFKDLIIHPYKKEGYWTPNISVKDLKQLKFKNNNDENCPTIFVKDFIRFFKYLTDITNNLLDLYKIYGINVNERFLLMCVMRRIWLRMGINDFNNVEEFLDNQLQFVKNDLFDCYRFKRKLTNFNDYDVIMKNNINCTYDETNRNMSFKIIDKNGNEHSLPHINYEISDDNICYIYSVQNDQNKIRNKKIERLLYIFNKGIKTLDVHPNQVYSMLLFINLLKKHGINHIRVPMLQVLSYRYHELLSKETKEKFHKEWSKERVEKLETSNDKLDLEEYKYSLKFYENVVDNQDTISKLKTENLINLFRRMTMHFEELEIINDIDVQNGYLEIKINNNKKLLKK